MPNTPLRINALIVDADDPERLAAFWSELLGRPVVGRTGPYVWLRREDGLGLGFQRADGANEFCVIPDGPFELDDDGRAHYLG
ncbi:VOC family protein [Streptomyces griseoluteus]|uniref:VOC family protein n=1 Tax=Streptomyces griseoluteus TaxID=29306 RepID=UPI0037007207